MRRLWLSTTVLCAGWLYFLPLTEPKNEAAGVLYLLTALLLMGRLEGPDLPARASASLPWAAITLVAGLLLPFPFDLALLLPALALALSALPGRWSVPAGPLLGVGLQCGVLGLMTALYWEVAPRVHALGWLSAPIAWIARALGLRVALGGGALYLMVNGRPAAFIPSLESLGGFYILAFSLLGCCNLLVFLKEGRVRGLAVLAGITLGYVLLRYALLAAVYSELWEEHYQADIYWRHFPVVLSFLPLSLLLMAVFADGRRPLPSLGLLSAGRPLRTLPLLGAAAFLLTWGLVYHDPGRPKEGRILVDEAHSDWEWTQVPYDTETFGNKTLYNYSELHRYLSYYYRPMAVAQGPLTAERLREADVLILKTPTRPYTREEVRAVIGFVRDGGGLLLVSDHTNVFGMSTYLNAMARPFGLEFRSDSTKDLPSGNYTVYRASPLVRHPALSGVRYLQFRTSCTLAAGLGAEEMITGHNLAQDDPDYGVHNFFGDFDLSPAEGFGLFFQMAGRRYGRGRVIAFTDSTIYSNFALFLPGISELLLGSVQWLNRTNGSGWIRVLLLVAGLAAAGAAAAGAVRGGLPGPLPGLAVAALGLALALHLGHQLDSRAYPPPRPHTPYPELAFDRSHGAYDLPIVTHPHDESPLEFLTFYLWSQKVGWVPRVTWSVAEAAQEEAVVFINPVGAFANGDVERLDAYLRGGGRVLVLDSPFNAQSSSGQITQPYGLRMETAETEHAEDEGDLASPRAGRVSGGEALIVTDEGDVLAAGADVGRGRIILVADADLFSNAFLGSHRVVPEPIQLERSDLAFLLFRELLAGRSAPGNSLSIPLRTSQNQSDSDSPFDRSSVKKSPLGRPSSGSP